MNLWNNVVRWELRTRLFLRTAEFLWQEAHTFHATEQEARDEVDLGLEVYRKVCEEWLAIPVIKGRKTEGEKFPGAVYTYSIEAIMRDRKALQAGTSHYLGDNFAKAAGITFLDRDNQRRSPHGTSWGFTTRMVGATVMVHGDDSGLVLPPNVAPVQVAVIPIFRSDADRAAVADAIERFELALRSTPEGRAVRLEVDWRDESPGFKYNHWELRGVPFRIEVGPRDVAARQGVLVRRMDRSREAVPLELLAGELPLRLLGYQQELFQRALDFRAANTHYVDDYGTFRRVNEEEGGFLWAHWCGSADCEAQVNRETGATIRNIPFDSPAEAGRCILDGAPSDRRVVFAKAY
jgi:prolyl-tRNA synthetase